MRDGALIDIQTDKYFKLKIKELVLIQFIIEAYEGLATVTTFNKNEGVIKVSYPSKMNEEVNGVIAHLKLEYHLEEIDLPEERYEELS